jgi:hypothetical protein
METSTTPSGDEPEVDPAARTEEDEANAPTPTETSQDVDGAEVSPAEQDPLQSGGDPANQVQRTSAPLPEQQGGAPDPDNIGDRAPAQTASTTTDRPSVPSNADAQGDADVPEDEAAEDPDA